MSIKHNKITLIDEIQKLKNIDSLSFGLVTKAEITKIIGNHQVTWTIDLESKSFQEDLFNLLNDLRSNNEASAAKVVCHF
ncbi:hypothetical protein KTJ53_12705 [Acinetobacter variabilis]|uniref:hypothetical protein n=1 Tax=Acinetobacter variabilis TaxID=70346 RepID=UPI0021CE9C26|nr:hypothetical protein [Acinetobacter variabilis]MCU4630533.1 hypothetical protein [Acinetobacter variabilis]